MHVILEPGKLKRVASNLDRKENYYGVPRKSEEEEEERFVKI